MAEHSGSDPEKISYTEITRPVANPGRSESGLTDSGKLETPHVEPAKKKSRFRRDFMFWSFLIAYSICCIALTVILAKVINGFNAADKTTPRFINGKLQLRVSDITTLISAGLVVIKLLVSSWTLVTVWRCAYELAHSSEGALSTEELSFLTKHKLPPWLIHPSRLPKAARGWIVSAILLLIFPQAFIAPLLSGAVD
jgi:hypothetical protein